MGTVCAVPFILILACFGEKKNSDTVLQATCTCFYWTGMGWNDLYWVGMDWICDFFCVCASAQEVGSDKCNKGSGTFECGICNCDPGHYGRECECSETDISRETSLEMCHKGYVNSFLSFSWPSWCPGEGALGFCFGHLVPFVTGMLSKLFAVDPF